MGALVATAAASHRHNPPLFPTLCKWPLLYCPSQRLLLTMHCLLVAPTRAFVRMRACSGRAPCAPHLAALLHVAQRALLAFARAALTYDVIFFFCLVAI